MGTVHAAITISLDGYFTGPEDGPGRGLGIGGERLHSWVFGGPWRYEDPGRGEPTGVDKAWLEETMAANGAVITGRGTYEAAGHWGGVNPWPFPCVVVTHRTAEQPPDGEFHFAGSVEEAVRRAQELAGDRQVHVMGGGQVIGQLLGAGLLDELTIIIAPLLLGRGKRLFEDLDRPIALGPLDVHQSEFATFLHYRVLGEVSESR